MIFALGDPNIFLGLFGGFLTLLIVMFIHGEVQLIRGRPNAMESAPGIAFAGWIAMPVGIALWILGELKVI